MPCDGKIYGQNLRSYNYLYSQFSNSNQNSPDVPTSTRNCRKYIGFYPSFTPVLNALSVNSSPSGSYSLVYISGSNFLPNGTTFIKFGNMGYMPVTYYSSFELSFVVPLNAAPGNYDVHVVNLYNSNFSPPVNQTYPGNLNFSNSINYTVT
jgi:hypothetical protein